MLNAIKIKNFKSTESLSLNFGRVNVLIGENGSGKSTILEALTFAAAAEANKLDSEFLENRGIRVTEAKLMRSNFSQDTLEEPIEIKVYLDNKSLNRTYLINNDNKTYTEWNLNVDTSIETNKDSFSTLEVEKKFKQYNQFLNLLSSDKFTKLKEKFDDGEDDEFNSIFSEIKSGKFEEQINDVKNTMDDVRSNVTQKLTPLKNFVIYAPHYKQLKNLKEEGAIRPVGIYGEGLFKLLREIYTKQPEAFKDIEKGLKLIGWYKSMDLENEPELIEDELFIQDKYLPVQITQRSANEGFLYILFYMSIIVSKDTPKIFAIDNIDAALNPKLCSKIMEFIVELSKKYDKQLFLTTQNPAILDGIDIYDDEQKLFVVSRKRNGQTTAKIFTSDRMPKHSNGEKIMLSEAMIKGFIGGIPRGF